MRLYFAGKEKNCNFAVEFIPHSREVKSKNASLDALRFLLYNMFGSLLRRYLFMILSLAASFPSR